MDKNDLLSMIEDDDLGLLKVKPKASSGIEADERLLAKFEDICTFVRNNDREPESGKGVQEHMLAAALNSIRQRQDQVEALKPHDELGLLPDQAKEIKSIDDVFNDDDLGILDDEADSIFTLKHVTKETTMPDYVAQRKTCADFDQYENKFKQCQADLSEGKRKLIRFTNEQQIEAGFFFVLKGILLFVAAVGEREKVDGKINARLHCVFENGTESDMLLRSLARELYKDGRRVTEHEEKLLAGFDSITDEDKETGTIYVLKSLSDKPEIKEIQNLYKIGYASTSVEDRIKNAAEEPTYLMAPVQVVAEYSCYNMNPQKLELILHKFFGASCLNMDVFDNKGHRHTPREWFIAPLDIIDRVITLIGNEEIVNYRYDVDKQAIVENL